MIFSVQQKKRQPKCDLFTYVIHKYALQPDNSFMSFKDHIAALWGDSVHAEPADIVYLSIVDMNADTIEAMSEVAAMLHKEYIATTGAQYLIVAGDAKTYLRLKDLKQEYGTDLDWLLPFIGDWHVLFNYQKALMKVYYEVGLKYLAKASGFKAETLTSLANSSNFKRTHAFLLQVWEVLYLLALCHSCLIYPSFGMISFFVIVSHTLVYILQFVGACGT